MWLVDWLRLQWLRWSDEETGEEALAIVTARAERHMRDYHEKQERIRLRRAEAAQIRARLSR